MSAQTDEVTAHPLAWPAGWKRAKTRERANFGRQETRQTSGGGTYKAKGRLTIADSRDRLRAELDRLGAKAVVISSNLAPRNDGQLRSGQAEPADPGVAVYFTLNGGQRCLPCDKWDRTADNLAAIAKYVDALRGQLRWGVGSVDAAFAGFKALPGGGEPVVTPAKMTVEQASRVVASAAGVTMGTVLDKAAWRSVYLSGAKHRHPDSSGQSHEAWNEYQVAVDVLKQYHGVA